MSSFGASSEVLFTLRGHNDAVNCVEFMDCIHMRRRDTVSAAAVASRPHRVDFENTCYIASGDAGGRLRVWNLGTRRCVRQKKAHCDKGVLSLAMLNDSRLLSQGRDGRICLWDRDIATDVPALLEIPTRSYTFCRMAIEQTASSSHGLLASSTESPSQIGLWDFRSGSMTALVDTEKDGTKRGMVSSLAFLRGSNISLLLSGSENGHVEAWDLRKLSAPTHTTLPLHEQPVFALGVNHRLRAGVSGSADSSLQAFQFTRALDGAKKTSSIALPNEGVSQIVSRCDEKIFAACCWDKKVRLFSWRRLACVAMIEYHRDSVFDVAFAPNAESELFATASKDSRIAIFTLLPKPVLPYNIRQGSAGIVGPS